MADLISRQAILKHIEKIRRSVQMMDDIHRASLIMHGMHLCEEAVMYQPSVDAVEVVRCKDCRKRKTCRTSTVWAVAPGDDWFCADGERRTDDRI